MLQHTFVVNLTPFVIALLYLINYIAQLIFQLTDIRMMTDGEHKAPCVLYMSRLGVTIELSIHK